jgi:competence CoiA-like predicted nuclease
LEFVSYNFKFRSHRIQNQNQDFNCIVHFHWKFGVKNPEGSPLNLARYVEKIHILVYQAEVFMPLVLSTFIDSDVSLSESHSLAFHCLMVFLQP